MHRIRPTSIHLVLLAATLLVATSGCGSDGGGSSTEKQGSAPRRGFESAGGDVGSKGQDWTSFVTIQNRSHFLLVLKDVSLTPGGVPIIKPREFIGPAETSAQAGWRFPPPRNGDFSANLTYGVRKGSDLIAELRYRIGLSCAPGCSDWHGVNGATLSPSQLLRVTWTNDGGNPAGPGFKTTLIVDDR